jgi:hypothetical protein
MGEAAIAESAAHSSRSGAQVLLHFCYRPVDRSSAALDKLASGVAHPRHFGWILQKVNPFDAGIFRTRHLNSGAGFQKASGNRRKIFH